VVEIKGDWSCATAKSSYHDYFAALHWGLLREGLAGEQHQQGEGGGGDNFHDFLGYVFNRR
jgi:hypothetical protein